MYSTFWSNTIWYVLLGITSVISIVFILCKTNNSKFIIGFSFAVLGATFFTETFLFVISNAYRYLPKISSEPYLDSIFGNYFSQFSVTLTAIFIIVYKLPKIWNFIFACTYFFIEVLFLKLGIYQHYWYKSIYTFIGLLLIFWIIKKWYYYMLNSPKNYIYYFSLFSGASALFSITIILWLLVFSLQVININFYKEFFRNQAILIILYRSILVIIMIILYVLKLKWMWKGLIFVFLFIIQYALTKIGIITIKDGWFLIVTLLDLIGCYLGVIVIDYLLRKNLTFHN